MNNATNMNSSVMAGRTEEGDATNNIVTLANAKIAQSVYGGFSINGNALNNEVNLTKSIVRDAYGGDSNNGSADSNSVILSATEVGYGVYGGHSSAGGNANSNSVTISDNSKVTVEVIGGYSDEGNATNNIVSINGTNDLAAGEIYGGYSYKANNTGRDLFTGNTLNWASVGSVKKVANFEYYNFYIPENAVDRDTLLTVAGDASTDLSNAKVKLVGVKGIREWQIGESVILIDNQNGIDGQDRKRIEKTSEGLKLYNYTISKSSDNKQLIATITDGSSIADYAKSLSEGRIAAIGFINTAADLASGSGLQNAIDRSSAKYDLFGAMNYSDSRYNSGSHADVKGNSMLLGFSRKIEAENSNWVVGAFLESGNSSYDTVNNFADFDGDVRANGKNNYFGGGIMARNVQNSGLYVDGSLRFGRMSTDYNSNDIETKYDIKSTYYGLHLGVGKVFKLNNSNDLDVYGKYFWSHQNAATANIEGDSFNFDSINSHRLRIGARLNMLGGGNGIKTYVGLAYEHEFSGSARATYSGENIAAPSIKGATGIGEIGMVYKPSTKSTKPPASKGVFCSTFSALKKW